ncbi:MAG: GTPase ObgE [Candidatus Pacebacteria bacterium]|nr:GTPase ObgE [Candidatus Paceibacterota bacterium]
MAFIDEITIYARAGCGGDGVERWLHEKFRDHGGPSGGDGGNGGDVYVKAVRDVSLLSKYQHKKEFYAQVGEPGGKDSLHGANGEDLDILLPIGSIITNKKTKKKISLDTEGERVLVLRGGQGGRGNESFKSSTNQRPTETTLGTDGEDAEFYIELELIADVGLIGFPSAGKTSLLNILTNAKGKVGAYHFTTLEPNLGEYFGYIIADVPGLIEGASVGKGLGHKFLRHIRRTKMLVHLVSLENEDMLESYKVIRKELEAFDKELIKKEEIILFTKTDVVSEDKVQEVVNKMKEVSSEIYTITLYEDGSVKDFADILIKKLRNLEVRIPSEEAR